MVLESVCATKEATSQTEPVCLVPNAPPTPKSKTMSDVSATLDLLTTATLAQNALKVLSGVLKPINASLFVAKIQLSLNSQVPVSATQDSVYLEDFVKVAPTTISSLMDIVLHAQLIQPSTQQPRTVTA
jgi:hypothetical protein